MSGSVFVALLLVGCVLQTAGAAGSVFKTRRTQKSAFSRLHDRLQTDADETISNARSEELSRVALQRRQQYVIGRDSTVGEMRYELTQDSYDRAYYSLAAIDQQVFVLVYFTPTIRVYDTSRPDHALVANITLPEAGKRIAACASQQILYVLAFMTYRLYRLDNQGNVVASWDLPDYPSGLYVNHASCSVTVIYPYEQKMQEFTDPGRPGPITPLNVSDMWQVIPKAGGRYLVSHGWNEGGVALVDSSGAVLQSDTIAADSPCSCPLSRPFSMVVTQAGFILVADYKDRGQSNRRVVLLDPSLRYIRDLVSRDHGLGNPFEILLDEGRGLLYVSEKYADDRSGASVKVFSLI